MKKILALLIAIAMMTALMASCGKDDKQDTAGKETDSSVAEDLTDDTLGDIFKDASEIGEGTAGVSLKRAQLASKIAAYAATLGFSADDIENLKKDMLKNYEALDKQGKSNLDLSFSDSFSLLDKVIDEGDYDSVKGQFEDAGVADVLEPVLKTPGLKESYDTFKSAYFTMSNSDD